MPRIQPLNRTAATGKVATLFDGIEKKLGKVPNMMRTMANAPAVLEAYLGFSGALAKGALSAQLREQISLTVGEANNCAYCLAAHTALGGLAGLKNDEINASRRGESADAQTAAALTFARKVVSARGKVSDDDVRKLRSAGFDDAGVAEIVANVAVNLFTNYFNHVADTEVDFPKAEALAIQPAGAY